MKVLIAICTFQRPELLANCLRSFRKLVSPTGVTWQVLVVDNDAERSALAVTEQEKTLGTVPLSYQMEEQRGIPFARNAAIAAALAHDADYLAFVDDDEWVEPDWLHRLFDYETKEGGKIVVSGGVQEHFPAETPDYISRLYHRKHRKTGTRLYTCATNNVLIPRHVFADLGLRFDVTAPLAGGTDTLFFQTASEQGVDIRYCGEALVHESIPASRATLGWLSKRKFRVGLTDARKKVRMGQSKTRLFIAGIGMIGIELTKSMLAALSLSKFNASRFWLRACKQVGIVSGLMGAEMESYKVIDR